ncbi:peptidoglycan hydrolase-like protein with peptidoglycan-binding domain [Actinopolyspora biskrensis]|uniref:Peptidoglycan hydrolase-like protein with peptidoglycan-binding domain n=1 Tax=Actinopolyspora biskrensis TaxID=1470178 RepID=A0A852YVS7_9ACTN|nr:peptidoglycan-binding domain-containing protein [Actinopolyspora biskrensis]NYH77659.1 peptidoglycan hydrolase-like protein with peptidoglycan-binding domain [Actinopolyspora biskrensis]
MQARLKKFLGTLGAIAAAGTMAATIAPAAAASSNGTTALPTCTTVVQYLPATSDKSWDCLLEQGISNHAVKGLQISLNNCNGQSLAEDGIYGPATRSAVADVQRSAGIAVDGVYGPNTRKNMLWLTATGCNSRN